MSNVPAKTIAHTPVEITMLRLVNPPPNLPSPKSVAVRLINGTPFRDL
jgi:hypothetical protein